MPRLGRDLLGSRSCPCRGFIVTTPTPIDAHKRPDLGPVLGATRTVAGALKPGDVVIYESTVYPGATEEECVPVLEELSGLRFNTDFFVGYSPERINPDDKEHRVNTIVKVTSASTPEAADFVEVIENTQRNVNIALINELPTPSTGSASTPRTCCWPPVRNGTSCRSGPAWSADTASASTPTT